MEHLAFHDTKWNWSEELLAAVLFLTMVGNIAAIRVSGIAKMGIGIAFLLMAGGILTFLIFTVLGTFSITSPIAIFLIIMMISSAGSGITLLIYGAQRKALGR